MMRSFGAVVIACCILTGCIARRVGAPRPVASSPPEASAPIGALPAIGYDTRFVGAHRDGSAAFAGRVGRMLARHPVLRAATSGDAEAPLHLDFTLTDRSNALIAGLSGIACGLSFTLLPAYARDDFDLDVELRDGARALWRHDYHDAVKTFVHFTLIFAIDPHDPRVVVEDVVDDLLVQALTDLDASGALRVASDGHGAEKGSP